MSEQAMSSNIMHLSENQSYNKYAFKLFKNYLGKNILEIGSGVGNNIKHIPKNRKVIATEFDASYLTILRKKYPKMDIRHLDIEKDNIVTLKKEKIDTILCFNVIEHIKNDEKAIKNMHSILMKNGYLILWVPAHKWLYGTLDSSQAHYRRYTRKELHILLDDKFETRFYHFNTLGIAGWFLYGKILRKKSLPSKELKIYDKLFVMLSFLEKISPIGLSHIVICRKK